MTPALRVDVEAFRDFFKFFRPKDLSEMYFLGKQFGPDSLSPMHVPWLFMFDRQVSPKKTGPKRGKKRVKLLDPSTSQAIDGEFNRVRRLLRSIQDQGYRPELYGDIQGYFLQLDGEYRFVVKGGKHRAAALTHLGFESIPVRMRPLFPRVIDGERVREWPFVRSGQMSADFALAVMRRYFEFDGTQQRDRIFDIRRQRR